MKHRILDPEDRKTLNRWRLAVIGFYGTIIAALVVVASLNGAGNNGTIEAQLKPAKTGVQQASGPRHTATQR